MKLLTKKQIESFCDKYPDWHPQAANKKLVATYTFDSHIDALTFIMRITIYAQVQQHHPDITFTYAKVKVSLTTHEEKGLTRKDTKLAKSITTLYQQQ